MTKIYENQIIKFSLNSRINLLTMDPFAKFYFGLLLLSPFLAYFIQNFLVLQTYYVLGVIAVVFALILATQKNFRIPVYLYPLILFCIYYSTWDFFNERYEEFGIIKLIFKNYSLHSVAVLLIIENTNINDRFINITLKIFKLLAIISFIVIIYQFLFNSHFFTPIDKIKDFESDIYPRNNSIWGYLSPWSVGLSLLPIMAIIVNHDLLEMKVIKSFLWLGVAGIVSFLTNDRWVMINFFLLLFLPIMLINGSIIKKITFSVFSSLIVILLLFSFINISGKDANKYYQNRILSKSADTRLLAFNLFSESFPQNPFLGTGVRVNEELRMALANRSSQIHVGYLSCLYEFGIIGSSFLFGFWFLVAIKFYRISRISKQYGLFVGFLCLLFANLTFVSYSIFQIGIIFLFIFNKFYTDKFILRNASNSKNNNLIS